MGRPATLTGDPLRLAAPLTVTRAVQRLDRAASTAWPLGAANRGLASLTCARFDALLDPPRGDDALAAALARYGSDDDTPVASPPLALRDRLERGVRMASPGSSVPARVRAHPSRPAAAPVSRQVDSAPAVGGAPRSGSTPTTRERHRGVTRRPVVAEARGLEWLADAVTPLREAAQTPLELAPAAQRQLSPQQAPTGTTPTIIGDPPARVRPLSLSANAETASRRGHPSPLTAAEAPPRPVATATHSAPAAAVAEGSGLESLVRAWNVSHPGAGASEAVAGEPEPAAPPVAADEPAIAIVAGDAPRPGQPSVARLDPVREDELLDLRDEVGRMLVAELRRYGIEVGP